MAILTIPIDQPLDEVVWQHYGHLDDDLVARVLNLPFNRKLAKALILPRGTQIELPDIAALSLTQTTETSFW